MTCNLARRNQHGACKSSNMRLFMQWWLGEVSYKDAVADVLGIATALSALVALEACHCLPGPRRTPSHPARAGLALCFHHAAKSSSDGDGAL
jgi:hypothetical protein